MFKLVLQVFGVPVTHQSGHPGAQARPACNRRADITAQRAQGHDTAIAVIAAR